MAIPTVKLTKMGNTDAERNYTNKVLQNIADNVNTVLPHVVTNVYDNGAASTNFNLNWTLNGPIQLIRTPTNAISSINDTGNPSIASWLTLIVVGPSVNTMLCAIPGLGASTVTPANTKTAIVRRFWDGLQYYNIVDGTTF